MGIDKEEVKKARKWLSENKPEVDLNRITGWDIYLTYLREIEKKDGKERQMD